MTADSRMVTGELQQQKQSLVNTCSAAHSHMPGNASLVTHHHQHPTAACMRPVMLASAQVPAVTCLPLVATSSATVGTPIPYVIQSPVVRSVSASVALSHVVRWLH